MLESEDTGDPRVWGRCGSGLVLSLTVSGWSDSVLLCCMLDRVGQSLGRALPGQGFIYIILMVTSVRLRENVEFKNKNTNAPNMQITRTERS